MSVEINLNDSQISIVKELKSKGLSYEKIVEITGLSEWSIRKYCNNNGLSTKAKRDSNYKLIEEMLIEGYTKKDIARVLKVSYSCVHQYCFKNGHKHINKNKPEHYIENRVCSVCGNTFAVYEYSNKKFCSSQCQKRENHQRNDIIRKRVKNGAVKDYDITLKKLFERDKGICYLCGNKCDWEDYKVVNNKKVSIGKYPTIEHLVPLSCGGEHSWENVKLAHFSCNCRKGVHKVG